MTKVTVVESYCIPNPQFNLVTGMLADVLNDLMVAKVGVNPGAGRPAVDDFLPLRSCVAFTCFSALFAIAS